MTTVYRGDNTGAFGNDFLRIYLNNPNNLEISRAVVQINDDIEKIYDYPVFPLRVNFSGEETEQLEQQNVVRMALWDANGKRRTAEGKFTFLVKENHINEPDSPTGFDEYTEDTPDFTVMFDLSDTEFAAKFVVNATPSNMSELVNDCNYIKSSNIIQGENVRIEYSGDDVVINADANIETDYLDLHNRPFINGVELVGDISLSQLGLDGRIDWNAEDGPTAIINKPNLARVAITGDYEDLINTPTIPRYTSELTNDKGFITKSVEVLDNFYTKEQTMSALESSVTISDIYSELHNKYNKDEIDDLLQVKVNYDTLNQILEQYATRDYVNTKINVINQNFVDKNLLNSTLAGYVTNEDLGRSNLTIRVNEQEYIFNADQHTGVDVDIDIPTKVSDLTNDSHFVTAEEISLDNIATKADIQNLNELKANKDEIGNGVVVFNVNNEQQTSFPLNSSSNHQINVNVPTALSQLNNDAGYLKSADIGNLDVRVDALEDFQTQTTEDIYNINHALQGKVDKLDDRELIPTSELIRLRGLFNYDDTELQSRVRTNEINISELDNNKVDKVPGKGLSTNDYTDEDKHVVNALSVDLSDITDAIDANSQRISSALVDIGNIQINVNNIEEKVEQEKQARIQSDNNLSQEIIALKERATIVDTINTYDELLEYDKSALNIGDIVLVLNDRTHDGCLTSYMYVSPSFDFYKTEAPKYTKEVTDDLFVKKETTINGHTLYDDIELTATDVHALPDNTEIGAGTVTVKINNEEHDTFNVNQSADKILNFTIPYTTSALQNDANFINQTQLDNVINPINTSLTNHAGLINANADHIGENAREIQAIKDILSGDGEHALPRVALTGSYLDLIDKPFIPSKVSDLENDAKYVTQYSLEMNFATKEDLPKKVSELENDRGYVTTNAIGRGILTFKINNNGWDANTWMANEKYDQTIDIPTENHTPAEVRASGSTLPPQAITVYNETKRIDDSCVHKGESETVTGAKTFANTVTFNGSVIANGTSTYNGPLLYTKNIAITTFDTNVANTKWVKDFTDTNVVHKTGNTAETITGVKTFSNKVVLNEAIGLTRDIASLDTHLATTKFVDNYYVDKDQHLVHKTGNKTETINGDKTFAESVTFVGNTSLGNHATVETKDAADNSNFVATTKFVKDQDYATNTHVEERCHLVEKTMDAVSEYSLKLQARVDSLEHDVNQAMEDLDEASQQLIDAAQVVEHMEDISDEMRELAQEARDAAYSVDPSRFVLKAENNRITGINEFTNTTKVPTVSNNTNDTNAASTAWVTTNFRRKDEDTFIKLTANNNALTLEIDKMHYVQMTEDKSLIINIPAVTDEMYHEALLQIYKTDTAQLVLNETTVIKKAGIYEAKYIWHRAAGIWVIKLTHFN